MNAFVKNFKELRMTDVEEVGGKNASLGEMISQLSTAGVRVPGGFATTAEAYRAFLAHNGLADKINARLSNLDVDDVDALLKTGAEIRQWVVDTPFPEQLEKEIAVHYAALIAESGPEASFAVRS
jgi:pyruvate,water dikinase